MNLSKRARTMIVLAILIVLVIVFLTGCEPGEGSWIGPNDPATESPRLAMIGDSLVDCCDEAWEVSYLPQTYPFAMWSVGTTKLGGSSKDWLDQLQPRPHVVIIAQGTNNAGDTIAVTQQALEDTLDVVSDANCIVLVNLSWGPGSTTAYQTGAAAINTLYTNTATASNGRIRVSNWRGWSYNYPSYFAPDGKHHSETGKPVYIRTITKTVNEIIAARGCI